MYRKPPASRRSLKKGCSKKAFKKKLPLLKRGPKGVLSVEKTRKIGTKLDEYKSSGK